MKRFLAHATQWIAGVIISTRKAAMCVTYVVGDIVQALKTAQGAALEDALEDTITYLACHAQRAHPSVTGKQGA